jgi:hypothetical protein
MGTKNNPKNRAKGTKKKQYEGKDVEAALYYGMHNGHGKYVSAKYAGTTDMICDKNEKPLPWSEI